MAIIVFIIILSVLVLIHEFGHFFMAKRNGIGVEEFGIGLPPRAWGKKIGETIYSVNYLPFGGFVRLVGEDSTDAKRDQKNSFYTHEFKFARQTTTVQIVDIGENSPAKSAGIEVGESIVEIDGQKVDGIDALQAIIQSSDGKSISIVLDSPVD